MANFLPFISSLTSFLAPMTVLSAVYYFLHIVFSAVLLLVVAPMEEKFTCASNDIYNHCVKPYESLYWLNLFVPLGIMVAVSIVIMSRENRVKKSKKCKFHIHYWHLMRVVAFLLFHCALGVWLFEIGTIKRTMNSTFTCVNGNSTFSCVDKLADYNISLCTNTALSFVINLVEVPYFLYRWIKTKVKRREFSVEDGQCQKCNYFVTEFKRVPGIILISIISLWRLIALGIDIWYCFDF